MYHFGTLEGGCGAELFSMRFIIVPKERSSLSQSQHLHPIQHVGSIVHKTPVLGFTFTIEH